MNVKLSKTYAKIKSKNDVIKHDTPNELLEKAYLWLEDRNCGTKNALIYMFGKDIPDIFLRGDKNYTPQHMDKDSCFGFCGKYIDFYLAYKYQKEDTKCMAFDLREWNGIHIRPETSVNQNYGKVNIRERTKEEIDELLKSGKIKPDQITQQKNYCVSEINLFWKVDENNRPEQIIMGLKKQKDETGKAGQSVD
ncbi:MAG: hypothetical protein ACYSU8_07885 [Planctomycetota bacterium]|jgi:hypothetical protein